LLLLLYSVAWGLLVEKARAIAAGVVHFGDNGLRPYEQIILYDISSPTCYVEFKVYLECFLIFYFLFLIICFILSIIKRFNLLISSAVYFLLISTIGVFLLAVCASAIRSQFVMGLIEQPHYTPIATFIHGLLPTIAVLLFILSLGYLIFEIVRKTSFADFFIKK
jgi:hypothetical protein